MMSNNPCGKCVTNAVRQGVDYGTLPEGADGSKAIVGSKYDGGEIHEAITIVGGTAVCWYHADDAAKSVGL